MAREPRNLADLLSDPGSALGRMVAGAAKRKSLIMQVKSCIDPELSEHLIGVNVKDDTLILLSDSAAWATRLRYAGPALCKQLSEQFELTLHKVHVKVRAPEQAGPRDSK
ncbi:MAG: DUF721 domain-containing protein [Chromatiales bacterium]|nr:DUF721 domain-containing protein [Chromatiales bacterium]